MPKGKTRSLYAKNSIFRVHKYRKKRKGCPPLDKKMKVTEVHSSLTDSGRPLCER